MKQPRLAKKDTFAARMKIAALKCLPALIAMVLLAACKGNNKDAPVVDDNPVYESNAKLKAITEQIKQSPKDATLYYDRGRMLFKMQADSLAIKDFKIASSLDTTKAEYYSAVGDVLFENKDLDQALVWIQKAIDKNPKDKKSHLKIAKVLMYIKQYPKSLAEINVVLRQDVYDPEAYFLKGMVYKSAKDTAKAISSFLTAVQVSPDYKDAMVQLGLIYNAKGDPIGIKYLENAYKLDTTDVFPLYAMGTYYQGIKDDVKAKEFYRKIILQNRHYVDAFFNIGYILMQEDSVDKAYRQYNIVVQIDPRNPTAYFNRGLCSEMMDSFKNAIADYRSALSLDPDYKSPKEALVRLKVKP